MVEASIFGEPALHAIYIYIHVCMYIYIYRSVSISFYVSSGLSSAACGDKPLDLAFWVRAVLARSVGR